MTVVFVKVECPRHPGRYTIGGPCDRCIDKDFGRQMDGVIAAWAKRVTSIVSEAYASAPSEVSGKQT